MRSAMAQTISNDLIQEVSKLAKILAENFTPPEFIPGCEIISIADINEYATNNGWVEAVCGQHNQQRVRWKSSETVIVGDFIDVLYFQDRQIFEAYGVGGSTAISPPGGSNIWPAPGKLMIGATEYATLAAAVAAAVSGDTIYAGVGTHTADGVTIPAGVNLWGGDPYLTIFTTSTSTTCLTFSAGCEAGNFTVTITTSSGSTTQAISIASNDVALNNVGYSGTNAGAGASYGCNISGGTGIKLWNNRGNTSKTRALFITGASTSVKIFGGTYASLNNHSSAPTVEFFNVPYIASASFGALGISGFYSGGSGAVLTPGLSGGGSLKLTTGTTITMFDDDDTLAANSGTRGIVQRSVKSYADTKIPKDIVDAKGDLIAATAADTVARLAAGADYGVLTALASETTGLKWTGTQENAPIPYNGSIAIWQRGTSFAAVADGVYTADGWKYRKTAGAMVHTISQSSDVPTVAQAGILAPYSLLVDCTTVDSSIAAGDLCTIGTRIEGFDFGNIAQRIFTCSFWVKATKTGIYCISFRNSGSDRSYVAEFTVNVTATWEYKTVTVAASPSAGTWDYTTGIGLTVEICLAGGATYNTTAGAWQTGSFLNTSNQVNGTDDIANDFRIALFDIVPGSYDRPFPIEDYQKKLDRCQRYFYIIKPVSAFGLLSDYAGIASSTTHADVLYILPVIMRVTGALTLSAAAGNYRINRHSVGVVTATALAIGANADTRYFWTDVTVASGLTAGEAVALQA